MYWALLTLNVLQVHDEKITGDEATFILSHYALSAPRGRQPPPTLEEVAAPTLKSVDEHSDVFGKYTVH